MALIFSFSIIILINFIFSISNENEYTKDEYIPDIFTNCSSSFDSKNLRPLLICILKYIRERPDDTLKFFQSKKQQIEMLIEIGMEGALKYIAKDIFLNDSNPILNDTFRLIKNYTIILNNFIDALSEKDTSFGNIFPKLKQIFQIREFHELFNKVYEKYKHYLYDIIDLLPKKHIDEKDNSLVPVLIALKNFIKKYQDILVDLAYKLIESQDKVEIAKILRDFFLNCTNSSLLYDLNLTFSDEELVKNISKLIKLDSDIQDVILDKIILNKKLMIFIIDFLHDETFVRNLSDILINLSNVSYINDNVPPFLHYIIGNSSENMDMILKAFQSIVRVVLTEKSLKNFVGSSISTSLKKFLINDLHIYKIGKNCIKLFDYTFFNPEKGANDFKFYYAKKLLIDSTKSRNDFLTYENCLNGYDKSEESQKYQIKPVYVVGKIIDRHNQSMLKNSIYYEKYNYILSFCFPQGIDDITKENSCSMEDYSKLLQIFSSLSSNMNTTEVKSFVLTKEDLKGEPKHYLYFSIIVIISATPLFVFIFLQLYKVIKLSNYRKDEINNRLTSESQNKNNVKLKEKEIQERELKIRKIMPKWFRFLNEYFNLVKNGSELFNFSLNQTSFNDFNGITYIKGILGLSMFLNIIGLTFFILSNLTTKILGSYQFYISVNNPIYIFAFIGLRYCPRIIFSCNGYTLIYKFLNFIDHDPNFCFFKFLILQSYKFILLIFVSLYLRFCLYYIDVIFLNIRNPMSELFHNQLEENSNKYFYNLLSFLFYNIQKNELFTNETAFIQYLYLPINEIFLFIVGIAIISFGYKFKLRFDIIIIVLFVLVYLFKILFFILYMYEREIYSTLYFFLHGYGVLMLNPIFNLPSFLVGMYFGLVNFTIHRGINNLNKDEKYKEYELLQSENQSINLEKTATTGEKKLGLYINNNNDLEEDKLSRILTYSRTNSTVFDENSYYVSTKKNNLSLRDEDEKSNTDAEKENRGNKEKKENSNHILKKMPFLKSTVNFTNFHRKNQNKNSLKIILVIFLILLVFFISVRYIFIHIYITKDIKTDARISDILSFEKIITNYFLNILYVVDIELVVIIINWICFYLYFKGGQINDFLNHIYWSFFIKSYFSYALVSCPVILYIFYQSETIVTVTIFNILLYSLISCFFVFIVVIVFYSFYEYPLRKIFKTLKIRRSYINIDDDDFYEEENDD